MSINAYGQVVNDVHPDTFLANVSPQKAAVMERVAKEMGIEMWTGLDATDSDGKPIAGDFVGIHRAEPGGDLQEFWDKVGAIEAGRD